MSTVSKVKEEGAKSIPPAVSRYMRKNGQLGGQARAENLRALPGDQLRDQAKHAASFRWPKPAVAPPAPTKSKVRRTSAAAKGRAK